MADNDQNNFIESLNKEDIQSVSSNGASVTLRSAGDKKAEVEKEILEQTLRYNPMKAMFGAGKLGSMR